MSKAYSHCFCFCFRRCFASFIFLCILELFLHHSLVLAAAGDSSSHLMEEAASAALNAPKDINETRQDEDGSGEDSEDDEDASRPRKDAWEIMWSGQREMVEEIRETALRLSDNFAEQTEDLSRHLQPFEENARRLLVFVNTFKGHPNALEAVSRRISATVSELDQVLEPVNMSRSEAQGLLERINYMAASLPDDADRQNLSEEMRSYIDSITRARLRLTAVLAQYNSLLPSLGLVKRMDEARAEIINQLPALWKSYYMQKPVPWLSPDSWINFERDMFYSRQALLLRLPVELPTSPPQWSTAIIRFFIGLAFAGILSLILKRHSHAIHDTPAGQHIFKVSLPWLILGFAFLGSAMSASGDFYRCFLAFGSGCLLIGQIFLAWDLRRVQFPDLKLKKPPFSRLLPLVLWAYTLLYLPVTPALALVLWAATLIVSLVRHKHWPKVSSAPAQFENGVMECYSIILWLCLFLALSGLHIYSIVIYLAYVSLALAVELSFAGMAFISKINEYLPQEGARAVLARMLVALAAPFVLVLAVAGVCLWILILPGGVYMLGEYALKGVTVGATQLNIIQLLLIISVFYLTRTVVAMGTRFLTKLPQQGVHFDATLITPMQTILTYAAWAIFGLFVLRSLGMELSSLAMVAGGLSVGIGFGMQTIVNNFLSGLILIFGRTLQVGDVVEVGNLVGRVRKISVRATMVETYDNAMIYVPNSEFMASRLINWTSFSRSVRREIQVGIAYGSDTQKAIKLLISIAKAHENVLKYPVPSVYFADFAASSLDFRLRFWVKDYELGASTASQIRLEIDRVFNEEKIEIAFPQLDVHLKDFPKRSQSFLTAVHPVSPMNHSVGMQSAALRPRVRQNPRIIRKRSAQNAGNAGATLTSDATGRQ